MKKSLYLIVALPLVFILGACSSLKLPGAAQPAATQAADRQGGFANFASQPVENKLAIGILKMEGTPNAVTPKEAQSLLPLWKAVKSLSTSNTTSTDEIQALYKQIEDTMTPAQVQAIKDLNLQQSDFRALMQQYGIQAQAGAFSTQSPSARATRQAQFQAQGGNFAGGGAGGNTNRGGGAFTGGGGFGGNFGGGNGANAIGQPNAQRTPQPGRRNLGGMNYLFVDPVIKLLQSRAA